MKRSIKVLIIVAAAVLVLGLAAMGYFGFLKPYLEAVSVFPENRTVEFHQREDGRLEMFWPAAENADRYYLEVLIPQKDIPSDDWEVAYSANIEDKTSHVLMQMTGEERAIRLRIARPYRLLFDREDRYRLSDDSIFIRDSFVSPSAPIVNWVPDPDKDTVSATFFLSDNCYGRAYYLNDTTTSEPFVSNLRRQTTFTFGPEQQFPMPAYGETLSFTFDSYRQEDGYIFYSKMSQPYTVTREDLLGVYIQLTANPNADNTYTLSWTEAKGDYYVLQRRDDENSKWEDLGNYQPDQALSFTTEAFEPYTSRQYQVLTYHDADKAQVSNSDVLPLDVGAVVNYSTIWPIKKLTVYSDPAKTQEVGTAAAGKALCVLSLEEGMFRVRTGPDSYGFIDSNYCMINLPDLFGDLLEYDITNSYASLFCFHGVEIEEVTGNVVTGYENIMLAEDEYLVPYIYPAALKLEKAALAAREKGYGLKIYDSFRPQVATQDLYARMESLCPTPIPLPTTMPTYDRTVEETEAAAKKLLTRTTGGTEQTADTEQSTVTDPTTDGTSDSITDPFASNPLDPEYLKKFLKADGTPMSYQEFITNNNRYTLNYFLAKGTSRHNRGAALDLTLTKKGENMEMQTVIHDLCWYSETARNTSAAKTLASIMKGAGFGGLASEWWHFQDNAALKDLDLPALRNGVTPEGWVADGHGWRYRLPNGNFYKKCNRTIEGVAYSFNSEGYASRA